MLHQRRPVHRDEFIFNVVESLSDMIAALGLKGNASHDMLEKTINAGKDIKAVQNASNWTRFISPG